MKVLYFHQHFTTPKGATGMRSYAMAQALIEAGHEVTMVCGSYASGRTGLEGEYVKGKREGIVDGINVIEINLPYSNTDGFIKRTGVFLKFAFRSVMIALRRDYDLVFATTTPLTAGIPGIFARWLRRKPFVFEVRDLWPELPKAMGAITNPVILKMMSVLEFASYRSAHHCIGLAPGIIAGIKERGVKDTRVTLIPNGCDIDLFQSVDPIRPEGVKDSDLMAVYGGTHGMANGLHNVLNAAEVLQERGRDDIKIILIGDGAKKPELLEQAKQKSLKNVIFLDRMPKASLAAHFAGADVGMQVLDNVSAFYFGTSPNKFFDYLSAGKPVVNNYPGWVAGMVNENDCGWAVEPDSPDAFADALEAAYTRKSELADMGARSLALAKSDFDRQKLAASFVSVLEQVGQSKKAKA